MRLAASERTELSICFDPRPLDKVNRAHNKRSGQIDLHIRLAHKLRRATCELRRDLFSRVPKRKGSGVCSSASRSAASRNSSKRARDQKGETRGQLALSRRLVLQSAKACRAVAHG